MQGFRPDFDYGFAVNGMLTITQLTMVFFGHKLSERFKLQTGWICAAILLVQVPYWTKYLAPEAAFITVFAVLLLFGTVNGVL